MYSDFSRTVLNYYCLVLSLLNLLNSCPKLLLCQVHSVSPGEIWTQSEFPNGKKGDLLLIFTRMSCSSVFLLRTGVREVSSLLLNWNMIFFLVHYSFMSGTSISIHSIIIFQFKNHYIASSFNPSESQWAGHTRQSSNVSFLIQREYSNYM